MRASLQITLRIRSFMKRENRQVAVIIGAGPAGLTAAYELLTRSNILPIVLEKSEYMGGLSRTVEHNGNRIDIGGHRFFSKSDRVMNWWLEHLPLEHAEQPRLISYHRDSRTVSGNGSQNNGGPSMLVRQRKSRIYFLRKFFAYPIQMTADTLRNLGLTRVLRIGFSYLKALAFPPKRVENLEQFFISRFGKELYLLFFKSYTEKVWGVPCEQISAEWGAQRIKGLSITQTLRHLLKKLTKKSSDLRQKDTETSLIEQFLYPKLGPGQLWEVVAEKVKALGGEIQTGKDVTAIQVENGRVRAVTVRDSKGNEQKISGDYFFSTMPIKELVSALQTPVPPSVREVSSHLQYRDFITVGLLVKKLTVQDKDSPKGKILDNWIYIQEPEVLAGRLQIFNNWSPYMVRNSENVWLGVEYFCYEADSLWKLPDSEMATLAARELERIGIIDGRDVTDYKVIRMPKTYPAYFGAYNRFDEVRAYLDSFENLFLVGRNGMHKYNNQDHSMLTAMTAVDNILEGRTDKSNIWAVNTEMDYHEEKAAEKERPAGVPIRGAA
jgi:protoporphyrinogen oxidase